MVFKSASGGKKNAARKTMRILNEAIVAAGGPVGLICCPTDPTVETQQCNYGNHPDIKLLSRNRRRGSGRYCHEDRKEMYFRRTR